MPNSAHERKSAYLVFVLLALMWGYSWIPMKMGLDYAGPFTFAALRAVGATVFLAAVLVLTGRPLRPVALRETALLGLLQTTGFVALIQLALVSGGAAKASVLAYTMPFWTVLLAWLFLGERLQPLQWLALVLAAAGMALVVEIWNLQVGGLGQFFGVAAGLSWAGSAIVAKRLREHHQVELLTLTTWQLALGTIPLILMALVAGERPVNWTLGFTAILLYTSVAATGLGWLMWLYVLHRLPAGTAGLNFLAVPVLAGIAAWLQFGETPTPFEGAGMVLIIAGLAVMATVGLRESKRAQPPVAQ